MAIAIDRIGDTKDRLGESPVWSAREGCLYWVDALAGLLALPLLGLREQRLEGGRLLELHSQVHPDDADGDSSGDALNAWRRARNCY